MAAPKVGILMGSKSDLGVMEGAAKTLEQFEVPFDMKVRSAHRTPQETAEYVGSAESRGIQVLIAGAGFAAHLAGALAAHSSLPIIAVPLDSSPLQGLDSLLASVQMPQGVPVACMTIGKAGAVNAALFAIQILSLSDPDLAEKFREYRKKLREKTLAIEL
ncbi:MAG: 5-(carboxyamino)imidazole ribonucleotide mutase [Acidobacteriota bacterium]|nr:5-(carboxyamino)imidazole ribonucleotide mutase [Acidobacteriota bacterium]